MLWWGCGILIVRARRKENTDSPVLHSRIGRGRQWVKGSEKKLSPTQQGGENTYKRNRKSCLRKVSPGWRDVGHRWRSRLMQTGLELLFSSSLIVDKDYIFCEHREDRNIEKDFKCSSERVVSLLPFVSSVTTWIKLKTFTSCVYVMRVSLENNVDCRGTSFVFPWKVVKFSETESTL